MRRLVCAFAVSKPPKAGFLASRPICDKYKNSAGASCFNPITYFVYVDCRSLSHPINGTVDTSLGTTYKKTAVYSCMTGFTLKGSYRRTCGETGQWSDDAPTCDIKGKPWYHLQEDSSIQLYDRVHSQRIIQKNMWRNWTVK